MLIRKFAALILTLALAAGMAGCGGGKDAPDGETVGVTTNAEPGVIIIAEGEETEPDTVSKENNIIEKVDYNEKIIKNGSDNFMYLYFKTEFILDGETAAAELYVDGIFINDNGEILYDDGHNWSLLVRQGDYVYPLISKQWIQLGNIKYYVCVDLEESTVNIIAVIQQGAGLGIYEYKYISQNRVFVKETMYETSGGGVFVYGMG